MDWFHFVLDLDDVESDVSEVDIYTGSALSKVFVRGTDFPGILTPVRN